MTKPRRIKSLPHKSQYLSSVIKKVLVALGILMFSLAVGVAGYSYFFKLGIVDSVLNASMILTGMGPVDKAQTDGAKLFSSLYAIYSGVAFLTSVAVIFGPVLNRFLHTLHLDIEE